MHHNNRPFNHPHHYPMPHHHHMYPPMPAVPAPAHNAPPTVLNPHAAAFTPSSASALNSNAQPFVSRTSNNNNNKKAPYNNINNNSNLVAPTVTSVPRSAAAVVSKPSIPPQQQNHINNNINSINNININNNSPTKTGVQQQHTTPTTVIVNKATSDNAINSSTASEITPSTTTAATNNNNSNKNNNNNDNNKKDNIFAYSKLRPSTAVTDKNTNNKENNNNNNITPIKLSTTWQLYVNDHKDKTQPYPLPKRCPVRVGDTKQFWQLWASVPRFTQLLLEYDSFSLFWFRGTIEPKWEDPKNENGTIMTLQFSPITINNNLNSSAGTATSSNTSTDNVHNTISENNNINNINNNNNNNNGGLSVEWRQCMDDAIMTLIMSASGESLPHANVLNGIQFVFKPYGSRKVIRVDVWLSSKEKSVYEALGDKIKERIAEVFTGAHLNNNNNNDKNNNKNNNYSTSPATSLYFDQQDKFRITELDGGKPKRDLSGIVSNKGKKY